MATRLLIVALIAALAATASARVVDRTPPLTPPPLPHYICEKLTIDEAGDTELLLHCVKNCEGRFTKVVYVGYSIDNVKCEAPK